MADLLTSQRGESEGTYPRRWLRFHRHHGCVVDQEPWVELYHSWLTVRLTKKKKHRLVNKVSFCVRISLLMEGVSSTSNSP